MPVTISPKYWAEHMGPPYHQAAIRPLEQAGRPGNWEGNYMTLSTGSRRFTRYGYADLMREDRPYGIVFRIWPGTQRLLLWGDPGITAGYGRLASFCGADGLELFEPLSFKGRRGSGLSGPRSGYADETLRHREGDWAKYKRTYRLFGRLLHNPDATPDEWRAANLEELGADGDAGLAAEEALACASRLLPLLTAAHLPSAANNTFWAELYTSQPIVEESAPHPYGDTPSPKLFAFVSPLDPQLFSNAEQFAEEIMSGQLSGKYSPLDVARWLETNASRARTVLPNASGIPAARNPAALRRLSVDVQIACGVGQFYAGKLRAAVAYAIHKRRPDAALLAEGVRAYESAIEAWRAAADAAEVYVDDLTYGPEPKLRGHWRDRLPAMEADLASLRALAAHDAPEPDAAAAGPAAPGQAFAAAAAPAAAVAQAASLDTLATPPARTTVTHLRPGTFMPGQSVPLDVTVDAPTVRLYYRHVNQAEPWQSLDMTSSGDRHRAEIPSMYTDTLYPLQYYFEIHPREGRPWLYPGLDEDLSNQPYFVVRHRSP